MRVDHKSRLNRGRGCALIDRDCRRRSWATPQVWCSVLVALAMVTQAGAAPVYPLKMSTNGRYLVDQDNVPYLITGDSPQALIVNLSDADAQTFLTDRATNGFNTVWINVLCDEYTGGRADGSTTNGTLPFTSMVPFTSSYDLTTPNEAYFVHVDNVINWAAQQGLLVILDPIETGGWLNTILNNGTNNCRTYGQYLGNRYKNFDNILWLSGNDYKIEDWSNTNFDAVVQAVALGIQDNDSRHIHTIELNYQVSGSLDDSFWAPIISLNASYTYFPTYAQVLTDYNRPNFLPTFMVEANYEFENDWVNNASGRRQEYWSLLSGACGQLYGNKYTWQFLTDWQMHLDTAGSTQMGYVKALFASRRWYDLVPDQNHTLVTAGYGTFLSTGSVNASDYATAASTADGELAMVYLPTIRPVTVELSKLNGPVTAQWYDPSSGVYAAIPGSPFANVGSLDFTPTGNNADGDGDWVLVLEATAPTLTISQPTDFQTFTNSPITVAGIVSDASGISSVTVKGTAATLDGSNWSGQVTLSVGTNLLTVIATDASLGTNSTTNTVHAIFQPPPAAFALISPLDGTANLSLQPVLAWTPSSSDAIYSVQVATTSDFTSPVFSQDGLVASSTTVTTGLIDGTTYFWRVTATNAGGTTIAANSSFSFAIISATSAIFAPPNVAVQCASQVPSTNFDGGNVKGNLPVSWAGDLTNNMTCPNRFTIQRTYTATDTANNTASCTQIITVDETTAPMMTIPADVATVTDAGQSYASGVVLGNATAVGGCDDNPTVANNAPGQFPVGTNTVVWTATDSCSSSTGTQLVIVVDNEAPAITQCAPSLTASATGNGQVAVPAFTNAVVATDNSTSASLLDITQDPTPGTLVALGTNMVTITVTDAAGNASQCTTSLIVTQTVVQVDLWEVSMAGKPRATCVLRLGDDSSVTGYGIEQSLCGAFNMTGQWSQQPKGGISGTLNQLFSGTSCQHATNIEGTFTTKPSKTAQISASGLDSLGKLHWKAVRGPSFPVLITGWRGTLKVKKSVTEETYNLTPGDSKPGWYDIQGQSADASYTFTGALVVTSHNLVTAWIVRDLPTGPVTSFYTGKVNLAKKKTLKLTGKDALGAKHQISAVPQ